MAKIKLEVTPAQLKAISELAADISAMIGCGDPEGADKRWERQTRLIDKMLKQNGKQGI